MPATESQRQELIDWLRARTNLRDARDLVVLALESALVRDEDFMAAACPQDWDPRSPASTHKFVPAEIPFTHLRKIEHVVDWIVASVINRAAWLEKVDTAGRPVKLTKIGSLDRAVFEADKAMAAMARRMPKLQIGTGEETYFDFEGGWRLVRMTTPEALDAESSSMQHCVGNGAYDQRLSEGTRIYLSLRDPGGKPHATLEIDTETNRLLQIQGKQNRPPERRYMDILMPYVMETPGFEDHLHEMGLLKDRSGRIHGLGTLPDDLDHVGTLILDMTKTWVRMPADRLVVEGNLSIVAAAPGATVVLPRSIRVSGTLQLSGDFEFRDDTDLDIVHGFFRHGRIVNLPAGLAMHTLSMTDIDMVELPEGISLGRLVVWGGTLASLPEGLGLNTLFLSGSKIPSLPCGLDLIVLHLDDCRLLTHVPDDLRTSTCKILNCELQSFPLDMEWFDLLTASRIDESRLLAHIPSGVSGTVRQPFPDKETNFLLPLGLMMES
jgi:hypothetical protein